MSYIEKQFSGSDIIIDDFSSLDNHKFVCSCYPQIYSKLTMNLNNVSLTENSYVSFKIIFNNQYPLDISKNYISEVNINGTNNPIKFNDNNNYTDGETSYYIIQEFIVKREKEDNYLTLSKIIKLQKSSSLSSGNDNLDILTVKTIGDNYAYYDISYDDYYTNDNNPQTDETYNDRNKIDVSLSGPEEDVADFDKFIVNLYEKDGDLIDTSGNEDETDLSSNTYSKGNTEFKFFNLIEDKEYVVKIHPLINNNNNYVFNLKDYFRVKGIHIETDISKNITEDIFGSVQYKDASNNDYSSIEKTNGINKLDTSTNTNHKFQITTLNGYKFFKINLSVTENIKSIKLIGDKYS